MGEREAREASERRARGEREEGGRAEGRGDGRRETDGGETEEGGATVCIRPVSTVQLSTAGTRISCIHR